jgi:CheY-like chemotaxis protein
LVIFTLGSGNDRVSAPPGAERSLHDMPTILLVDDEPACRNPLSRLLQIDGYEVTQADDGFEALQRLGEQRHDLILLDLMMPRMDGVTFLERIRADATYKDLPVFLLTAAHDPRLLDRAKAAGIQNYLFKGDVPFSRMLELIKTQLGQPFTPVRRGRRPKSEKAAPPGENGKSTTKSAPGPDDFAPADDEKADAEFLRD